LLEARGIEKSFPGVRALAGVDLAVGRGEVVGLVGENGAGKSTLVKILAGVQDFDRGELRIDGEPVRFLSVHEAQECGIAMIHQELLLVSDLSVAANLSLGREPRSRGLLDRAEERRIAVESLARLGLDLPPSTSVGELALGQRQMVEIAKALAVEARLLIMDEPTSSLSPHEAQKLFSVIQSLREGGVSVLYISHRLAEVIELCDRVYVLRDGERVGELGRGELEHDAMVRMMIGRDVSQFHSRTPAAPGRTMLQVEGLRTPASPTERVSLAVHAGEVVGIAGLVGAGRTELLECLFGVVPPLEGTVRVDGREVSTGSIQAMIEAGVVLVPEDRQHHGLVMEESVRDNLSLTTLGWGRRHGWRDRPAEAEVSGEMVRRLSIRVRDDLQEAGTLSGGNQQKVVLGKWLAMGPRVLLLDEPTRGVDVGSKAEIYALLEGLAAQGLAVLFVSSELEEILGLADRCYVMREGRLTGELAREAMSEASIMDLATAEVESREVG